MALDKNENLDPRCQNCEEKDCGDCAKFGTKLLLTDPPLPWPRSGPIKGPKAGPLGEKFRWTAD